MLSLCILSRELKQQKIKYYLYTLLLQLISAYLFTFPDNAKQFNKCNLHHLSTISFLIVSTTKVIAIVNLNFNCRKSDISNITFLQGSVTGIFDRISMVTHRSLQITEFVQSATYKLWKHGKRLKVYNKSISLPTSKYTNSSNETYFISSIPWYWWYFQIILISFWSYFERNAFVTNCFQGFKYQVIGIETWYNNVGNRSEYQWTRYARRDTNWYHVWIPIQGVLWYLYPDLISIPRAQ